LLLNTSIVYASHGVVTAAAPFDFAGERNLPEAFGAISLRCAAKNLFR